MRAQEKEMIWKELDKSLIFTGVKAERWQEVLQQAGSALQQKGYAKDTYIEALLEREVRYPTGIDIRGIGVAIPHTDPCQIKKEGLAILTLASPVTFGKMGTEQGHVNVSLVFVLAVKEPGSQIERLRQIMNLIQDREVLKKLQCASKVQDVIDVIREKEETP